MKSGSYMGMATHRIKFHWNIVRGQLCSILSVKTRLHMGILKLHMTEFCRRGKDLSYKTEERKNEKNYRKSTNESTL